MSKTSYDPVTRQKTLEHRGLDFEDAAALWARLHLDRVEERRDDGKTRIISIGTIGHRVMVIVPSRTRSYANSSCSTPISPTISDLAIRI